MTSIHNSQHPLYRSLLITGLLLMLLIAWQSASASNDSKTLFKRVPTQYIAALGDPTARSGSGAETWGLWTLDPGPRGVKLKHYEKLKAAGGIAPANWKFDNSDWWLEENGLIMEAPDFPLPPGKYLVTGNRQARAVLTIHPSDDSGSRRWELNENATLHDVTHLGCRSARYTPADGVNSCTPALAPSSAFKVRAGAPMPPVEGCNKQDYLVLIVFGVAVNN